MHIYLSPGSPGSWIGIPSPYPQMWVGEFSGPLHQVFAPSTPVDSMTPTLDEAAALSAEDLAIDSHYLFESLSSNPMTIPLSPSGMEYGFIWETPYEDGPGLVSGKLGGGLYAFTTMFRSDFTLAYLVVPVGECVHMSGKIYFGQEDPFGRVLLGLPPDSVILGNPSLQISLCIPEPATLAFLAIGGVAALWRKRGAGLP